jgi:RNA polymerase sigma-70 factor
VRAAAENTFRRAIEIHGDVGLSLESYANRLASIASAFQRQRGDLSGQHSEVVSFVSRLHTDDLYLALACVQGLEAAWERFNLRYRPYVEELARRFDWMCDSAEIADAVLADLWLPDRSCRPRIASYDCRYSLATWLRAIVAHRMINEKRRKPPVAVSGSAAEPADDSAIQRAEAAVRESRYAEMVRDSLLSASEALKDNEALILLLVYVDGLTRSQVGARLGVHRSTVNHLERRLLRRLRGEFVSVLETKYRLSQAAVQECVAEALQNPAYSLTALMERRVKK